MSLDSVSEQASSPVPPPALAARPSWMLAIGNTLFRHRNAIFPIAFLVITGLSKPHLQRGSMRGDLILDAIGIAIAAVGQILRFGVIGLAYIHRGGKDRRIYAEGLVQEGIFAHSRNPLYLGNMLVFLGLFVVLNSTLGWLVGVPFFLFAYLSITAAEEDFLHRNFGATYDDYCRRVPRFLPNWAGIGKTLRSMRFDWWRVVRKEYGSTFTWMTTALGLIWWESVRNRGLALSTPVLRVVALLWIPVVVGYGTARFLKKSGRI